MTNGQGSGPKVPPLSKIYEQSFWLYTVIIGLAIRQVLIDIIPRFLNRVFATALPLPTPEPNPSAFYIELVRSLVFLVVITRFYLGSVLVFAKLTPTTGEPPARSWVHIISGFIHFLLFFAWAYTPFVTGTTWGTSLFVYVLMSILLWDVLWFCSTPKNQKPGVIKGWLYRNLRTLIYIVFFSALWFLSAQLREMLALLPVLVISIADCMEILTKREPPQEFFALF